MVRLKVRPRVGTSNGSPKRHYARVDRLLDRDKADLTEQTQRRPLVPLNSSPSCRVSRRTVI
jgi:hypothetical protein